MHDNSKTVHDLSRPLEPIPTPASARWREFRERGLPLTVFMVALGGVIGLWSHVGLQHDAVGIGEGVRAVVTGTRAGVMQRLLVQPYQVVQAGDPVAIVLPVDPMAQIDLVQTELEIARVRLAPTLAESNAMDYERLRADLLRTKSELAMARIQLIRAENEASRQTRLFADRLISEDLLELAVTARDLSQTEVAEKSNTVSQLERRLEELRPFGQPSLVVTNDARNAIANRLEAVYQAAATNWLPVTLTAPITGMVQGIHRRAGESVVEGEALITIGSLWSERIVGYLRQPYRHEPTAGSKVSVATRHYQRQRFESEVIQVGAQFEILTNAVAMVRVGALVDAGLPVAVAIPPGLQIRPGELVDLRFTPPAIASGTP